MLGILVEIQCFCIFVLIIESIFLIRRRLSYARILCLLTMLATIIDFTGYLFELIAHDKDMAIQAAKFSYLGKPFIVLCLFYFVAQICDYEIPKRIKSILTVIPVIVMITVFTCEYHNLFYSNIEFTKEGFFPHLVLKFGLLYKVNNCINVLLVVAALAIAVSNFEKNKYENSKVISIHILSLILICFAAFSFYVSGKTYGYDSTIVAFFVTTQEMLYLVLKHGRDNLDLRKTTNEVISNYERSNNTNHDTYSRIEESTMSGFPGMYTVFEYRGELDRSLYSLLRSIKRSDDILVEVEKNIQVIYAFDIGNDIDGKIFVNRIIGDLSTLGIDTENIMVGSVLCDGYSRESNESLYKNAYMKRCKVVMNI